MSKLMNFFWNNLAQLDVFRTYRNILFYRGEMCDLSGEGQNVEQ